MSVAALCEGYHWSLDQALAVTMPQMIMLNHAAWINRQNSDKRYEAKKKREKQQESSIIATPEEHEVNDYVSSLEGDSLSNYLRGIG